MAHPITGIDHALVGVRDLESARARYARLGFTTCPRGRHIGWGTANYCIMFARDYVELIGIVEPSEPSNNLDRFLESREGLMGLAWASGDAAEAKRTLAARGIAADGPRDLARRLELDDGTVEPAFKLVHLRPAASPAYRSFVCQHLTPGLMRRADWLTHANGARAIRDATAVVEEPTAVAPAYAALFDGPVEEIDGGLAVRAGRHRLAFVSSPAFAGAIGRAPAAPALAALTIEVAQLAATAAFLGDAGVAAVRRSDRLDVAPMDTCGVWLSFVGPAGGP